MTEPSPCVWTDEDGGIISDHDWRPVRDWYGDPDVIGGTADCSFFRCRNCGEEDHETRVDPSDFEPDFDEPEEDRS
jgi:hypothetical protein